jgi:uncharacterized membrane protein
VVKDEGRHILFFDYSIWQLILFFFIYGFLGWLQECVVILIKEKRLTNRGFLTGPICPVYSIGAFVILLITTPFSNNLILVFLTGMIGTTLVEYTTSVLMDFTFKTKWWDYTHHRFNYKGRICLSSSLFWGVLSVVLTKFLHPYVVVKIVEKIPMGLLMYLCVFLIIIFIADAIVSCITAVSMRKIVETAGRLKEQLTELTQQLSNNIIKVELQKRISKTQYEYDTLIERKNYGYKRLLRAFPKSRSYKFNEVLTELKIRLIKLKKGKTKDERNLE